MSSTQAFDEGASFILVNLPKGSNFAIDCHSWVIGENFRGVKQIPPGWHIVSCSSCGKSGMSSSSSSFFHKFEAREIYVKKWNQNDEDFDSAIVSSDDIDRFRNNKAEVDCYLGLYPIEEYRKWLSLSNFIRDDVVSMLMPLCGYIYSATQFLSEQVTFNKSQRCQHAPNETVPVDLAQAESRMPQLKVDQSAKIRYSDINLRSFQAGASASSITDSFMDSSHHLDLLLKGRYSSNSLLLLGELQFAFISFLICQNYDSFEQWKRIVELICCSDAALGKYSDFFVDFQKVLYYQLKEVPSDFFVDIVSSNNFLTVTLHRFFVNVGSSNEASLKLKHRVEKFKKHVTEHFKWDFSSDLADEQPVIVYE